MGKSKLELDALKTDMIDLDISLDEVVGLVLPHRYIRGMRALLKGHEIWYLVYDRKTHEVSNMGRVKSLDRYVKGRGSSSRLIKGKILTPSCVGPYLYVLNNISLHRLVLETFVGPCPEGMLTRHFPDKDTKNNRLDNLCWGTQEQNQADRDKHGTHQKGEQGPNSKLKNKDINQIFVQYNNGSSMQKIAAHYGISPAVVYDILHRNSYKDAWVENPAIIRSVGRRKIEVS